MNIHNNNKNVKIMLGISQKIFKKLNVIFSRFYHIINKVLILINCLLDCTKRIYLILNGKTVKLGPLLVSPIQWFTNSMSNFLSPLARLLLKKCQLFIDQLLTNVLMYLFT